MRKSILGLGVLSGILLSPLAAHAEPVLALVDAAANQQIVTFDSAAPATITRTLNVTGLGQNEKLVAMDVRPSNGVVHVLSNERKLYTVNAAGAATLLITIPETGTGSLGTGDKFDMDFNPSGEAVRLVNSATRQNIRVVVAPTPAIGNGGANDNPLSYDPLDLTEGPNVVGIGYTKNFGQAVGPLLFGINVDLKGATELTQPADRFQFVQLTSTTAGHFDRVTPIKDLGFNVLNTANGGFGGYDVSPNTGAHFFAVVPASDATKSHIYRVSAPDATATFTDLGAIGSGIVRDIAVAPTIASVNGVLVTRDAGGHKLSFFNSATPGTVTGTKALTGLNANENILAIDRRPKNNNLYAITNQNRLLLVDRNTGACTAVGAPFAVALTDPTLVGMDFNPAADAIRVVSGAQNFAVNPDTGVATAATDLTFTAGDPHEGETPNVAAAGYTRNVNDGGAPRLYVYSNKVLASQGFALDGGTTGGFNGGQLSTLADLEYNGTNTTDHSFDVVGDDIALLTLTTANGRRLYQLDLTNGALRYGYLIGQVAAADEVVAGVAFDGAPVPPPPGDAGADGGGGVDSGVRPDSGSPPGPVPTTSPTTPAPGADGGANADGATEGGGCDCSTVPGGPAGGATLALGIGAVAVVVRRRRRS